MHWSQSRLDFDPEKLYAIGVRHVYVLPGYSTADWFCDEDTFRVRLEELSARKDEVERRYPDMQVHFFGYTSCHPEGYTQVPAAYQRQIDINGNPLEAFVCLRDTGYRKVLLERFRQVAQAGFRRVFLDDDLRDALCFCPLHISHFSSAVGRNVTRTELATAFRDTNSSKDSIELRRQYIALRRETVVSLAQEIERAVHEVNPRVRLGICLSARRFQDLTGIGRTEIVEIFDTSEAQAFARLPGEHYSPVSAGMACSVGYHTYYDAILSRAYERAWEATAVSGAPYQPKSSSQMVQEGRISRLLGLGPTLWAWTEGFDALRAWPGLLAAGAASNPGQCEPDREYLGVPVFVQTGIAHELSLKEHLSDGIIKGYQALSLMGLPLRLASEIRPEDDTICLFGAQPVSVQKFAERWLDEGRTLVLDLPAARKLCERLPDILRFRVREPAGVPSVQVSVTDKKVDYSVAGFPIGSVATIEGDDITPLTRIRDVDRKDIGAGIVSARAGGGTVLVIPFDLERISSWISQPFYRDLLTRDLTPFRTGRLPYLAGDAFLQLVLFREGEREEYLAINYGDYAARSELWRAGGEVVGVDVEPLGVVRGEV